MLHNNVNVMQKAFPFDAENISFPFALNSDKKKRKEE